MPIYLKRVSKEIREHLIDEPISSNNSWEVGL